VALVKRATPEEKAARELSALPEWEHAIERMRNEFDVALARADSRRIDNPR
jgi:hypothetical protein